MTVAIPDARLRVDLRLAIGFAGISVLSFGIIAAPLASYVLLIAVFGLPHVIYEMRYVDERFSARLPGPALVVMGALLAGVAGARIGRALDLTAGSLALSLELGFGAALAAAAVFAMKRRRIVAALVAVTLVAGIITAPALTLLVIAWIHNLTPLAFVAERAPAPRRARLLGLLAIPFLLWPAVIATGAPLAVMRAALGVDPQTAPSLFGAGAGPLSAFLTPDLDLSTTASLFAAAVTAQAMHYFAVIVMLPRLLPETRGRTLAPWPPWLVLAVAVTAAAGVSVSLYAISYPLARSAYGVAAALHSWIELPILLIALGASGVVLQHKAQAVGGEVRRQG